MRAICLWQPWASLVVHGFKELETRGRDTAYRGPVAIVATKPKGLNAAQSALHAVACAHTTDGGDLLDFNVMWPLGNNVAMPPDVPYVKALPLGIVGTVELVDTFPVEAARARGISAREYEAGNYEAGRWCWKLAKPVALKTPIPFKGRQFWFSVPDELLAAA